MDKEGEIII